MEKSSDTKIHQLFHQNYFSLLSFVLWWAMLWIPFRSHRNGQNSSLQCLVRCKEPPCSISFQIPPCAGLNQCSSQNFSMPGEMSVPAQNYNTREKKKKNLKKRERRERKHERKLAIDMMLGKSGDEEKDRKRVKMRRKKVENKIKGDGGPKMRRKRVNMRECWEDLGNRKN